MGTLPAWLAPRAKGRSDGRHAIELFAYTDEGRFRRSISATLGIYVRPADWDARRMRIKGNDELTRKHNRQLELVLTRAADTIATYWMGKRFLSHDALWAHVLDMDSRRDFLSYMAEHAQRDYDRGIISKARYVQIERTHRKLVEYRKHWHFEQISREELEKFDAWHSVQLREAGHLGDREREKALKIIAKYMRRAAGDQISFIWPYEGLKWPRYHVRMDFLTEEDVRSLAELHDNTDMILARMLEIARERGMAEWNIEQYASESGVLRIRDTIRRLLFQTFTGLRYGDAMRVRWDMVRQDRLCFVPYKTRDTSGKEVKLYLSEAARRYAWPPNDLHARGAMLRPLSNQAYNRYLKEVADVAEMDIKLTTHTARHTFATLYLARGGKVEALMPLLGVTKMETLMVYVHVTDQMVDNSVKAAFDDFF